MRTEDETRESDAYPAGTVAASEDDTDPADRTDDDDCDAEEEAESQCGTTGFEEEGKP